MKKIEGKIQLTYKGEKYEVGYVVDDGLVKVDKRAGYDNQVYRRVLDRANKKHQEEIEKYLYERYQNEELNDTKKEGVSNKEEVTLTINVLENENDTKIDNYTFVEESTLLEKDAENKRLLERIKELEEELKKKKGGRPAIGETRKVSLTLPAWVWEDIDRTVRVSKIKQSAFLRDLIMDGYNNHLLALSKYKGGQGDEG